jgi:hypothetical protein
VEKGGDLVCLVATPALRVITAIVRRQECLRSTRSECLSLALRRGRVLQSHVLPQTISTLSRGRTQLEHENDGHRFSRTMRMNAGLS